MIGVKCKWCDGQGQMERGRECHDGLFNFGCWRWKAYGQARLCTSAHALMAFLLVFFSVWFRANKDLPLGEFTQSGVPFAKCPLLERSFKLCNPRNINWMFSSTFRPTRIFGTSCERKSATPEIDGGQPFCRLAHCANKNC